MEYISRFEHAVSQECASRGLDGVVCGHIHYAEMREMHGVLYCNDGDWVESCTALVEHFDGRLEILRWADLVRRYEIEERPAVAVEPVLA